MRQGQVKSWKVVATFLAELVQDQPTQTRSGVPMLSTFKYLASRLRRDETGATAVEYGIMVALIAVVIIVAVTLLGTTVSDMFHNVQCGMTTSGTTWDAATEACVAAP
jgi:pilus assembly protein Flp/PilA